MSIWATFGIGVDNKEMKIKQALVKSLVWRIIGFAREIIVALIFTGSIGLSLNISVTNSLVAFFTYFIFELIWERWIKK